MNLRLLLIIGLFAGWFVGEKIWLQHRVESLRVNLKAAETRVDELEGDIEGLRTRQAFFDSVAARIQENDDQAEVVRADNQEYVNETAEAENREPDAFWSDFFGRLRDSNGRGPTRDGQLPEPSVRDPREPRDPDDE